MNRRAVAAVLIVSALLSGTVIYPAVHDAGHLLAGVAQGLHVREVVWTAWGGSPHVSFHEDSPPSVDAWVAPAGLLLPTLVGTTLLLVALFVPRLHGLVRVSLIVPGAALLGGNRGTIAEALRPAGGGEGHMGPLAEHLQLTGAAGLAFQLLPGLYTLAFLVMVVVRVRRARRGHVQEPTPGDLPPGTGA